MADHSSQLLLQTRAPRQLSLGPIVFLQISIELKAIVSSLGVFVFWAFIIAVVTRSPDGLIQMDFLIKKGSKTS